MLEKAVEVVDQLNLVAFEVLGEFHASLFATADYIAVTWDEEVILWDSEYTHRDTVEFGEDDGYECTTEVCWKVLAAEAERMTKAALAGLNPRGESCD